MFLKKLFGSPLEEKSFCAIAFEYAFGPTVLAIPAAILATLFHNPYTIIGIMLFGVPLMMYFSQVVYNKFVSPKLQAKGWNENSMLRGIQLILTFMLIVWFLPIAVLVLAFQLFGM